ncbi:hypothetical protein FRACYDRAFT_247834 [Fragilariopsis cylindrus CCMP1102]|uniref:Uncharacterized protein n=1 Tax=Fragilariopsis cylindrus CCMP1102 TaxID=635003 RepID=A0A1E7EWK6_9STRA|nr:hypothetical protein FRACYDRAFT_247834 [Fragilariopsis cylindrus CCMP1102]|eukprot:OEU10219.1 hypothetical protein FRACYDRAFT_247834 [Fragilariopsis cylindrus CCMP1102]
MTDVQSNTNSDTSNNDDNDEHDTTSVTTMAMAKQQKQSVITKSTPSFLSPVGAMSRNYSVALDEDDVMDLSPNHSSSRINNNVNNNTNNSNNNSNRNDRYWESDYEANYNGVQHQVVSTDEEYKYNENNNNNNNNNYDIIDNDNDLPTPLLGYNRNDNDNDDDDDHYYHHRRNDHDHDLEEVSLKINDHQQRQHQQQHHHQQSKPKLNGLNYLNVITYVLNVFTSYFIGVRGLFGILPTRRDIFIEYETLVTPADYAYYLWAPILVFEFFFATAQLFPHYRARPIIQQGTGLYFFWACIIQTIWTICFAMKWFISSFVAVCLALLCLVLLLASQHYNCLSAPTTRGGGGMTGTMGGFLSSSSSSGPTQRRKESLSEYWLFRFPFYLHCGWLLVCTVVQFSMVFRYRFTGSSGAQLMADIVALGVLLPPSTFFLTGQSSGPDFVIPVVIIWSYISIGVELHNPDDRLVELYGHPAIIAVENASYVFTGIIVFMLIPRIIVWIAQEFCTIDVVELIDEEEDNISTAMNEVRRTGGLFERFSLRGRGGGGGGDGNDEPHDEKGENDDNKENQNENENANSDEEAVTEVTEEEDNCNDEEKNQE